MVKILNLILIYFLLSVPARGEWVFLQSNYGKNKFTEYYDPDSREKGRYRKLRILTNYDDLVLWKKNDGSIVYHSTISIHEFDCEENQMRVLSSSYYCYPMAAEYPVYENKNIGRWQNIWTFTIFGAQFVSKNQLDLACYGYKN